MSAPHVLDHDANVYLTVTLSPTSPFFQDPAALAARSSALTHLGTVGQMEDVQLLSVPRETWGRVQGDVLSTLNSLQGIARVDVHDPPRRRMKRGGDEL